MGKIWLPFIASWQLDYFLECDSVQRLGHDEPWIYTVDSNVSWHCTWLLRAISQQTLNPASHPMLEIRPIAYCALHASLLWFLLSFCLEFPFFLPSGSHLSRISSSITFLKSPQTIEPNRTIHSLLPALQPGELCPADKCYRLLLPRICLHTCQLHHWRAETISDSFFIPYTQKMFIELAQVRTSRAPNAEFWKWLKINISHLFSVCYLPESMSIISMDYRI